MRRLPRLFVFAVGTICGAVCMHDAQGATPTVQQALGLSPVQTDVDCDKPVGDAVSKATIEAISEPDRSGWQVFDGQGRLLRRFVDSNGDQKLDVWSYYKNGIEVYRVPPNNGTWSSSYNASNSRATIPGYP